MATEIDELQIKIEADSKSASDSLDALAESISKLTSSLSNLSTDKLSTFTNGLGSIGKAVKNLKESNIYDISNSFESLGKSITSLSGIKLGDINKVIKRLEKLPNINKIEGLADIATPLTKISEPISKFSESLSKLENVDKLNRLGKGIRIISDSLAEFKSDEFSSFEKVLGSLSQTIKTLNDVGIDNVNAISKNIARIGKVDAGKIKSLSEELPNLSNSLGKIASSSVHSQNILDIANSLSKFGNKSVTQATANIPNITKNFNSLVNTFTKSFRFNKKSVSTASQGVLELATAFSRFGYKTSTEAIKNIPLLTKEFKEMLETLSKTPNVSKDLVEFTKALSNLSGKTINFKNLDKSITSTNKSTMNLALSFGKLYAVYRTVIGGIQGLWGSIETASSYLETLNYFEEAFGQVADNADLSKWKELGYESAESYANSFMERASELTSKLTGFNILPEGTLEFTGLTSLGVDPSQVMQYQAVFGQMASSMGVASETAVDLSNALTMIGLDLASARNMDFESVWEDMASGLAGMSRTLDKYGVNIRNVNLQQKLTELGVEANIASLNQNDKALLRTIILLENTDYAYGDLAETLNLPANQLRLLSSNMENLSRIIGNLFLPIVQTTLPYINGFVIALQRMFTWVGTMMGVDLSEINKSKGENPLENIIDGSEELEETLDGSLKASEKLKKSLRSFDELKTISSETASLVNAPDVSLSVSGGVLDTAFQNTLAEYQKAWEEAFANVENNAQEFADKIESYLQPVKNIVLDFQIGDYFRAGEDVSNLVVGITEFLTNAIDTVDWEQVGKNIGLFIEGIKWGEVFASIADLVFAAIEGVFETWTGTFNAAPVETIILTGLSALTFSGLTFPNLLGAITTGVSSEISSGISIPNLLIAFGKITFTTPIGMLIGIKITEELEEWITENFGQETLDFLAASLTLITATGFGLVVGGPIGALVGLAVGSIIDWFYFDEYTGGVSEAILGGLGKAFDTVGKKLFNWDKTRQTFETMVQSFAKIKDSDSFLEIGENIINGILAGLLLPRQWISEPFQDLFEWISESICKVFGIHSPADKMKPIGTNIILGIAEGFSDGFDDLEKVFKNLWNSIANWINKKLELKIPSAKIFGETIFEGFSINLGKLPTFSTGGFPEDGLFYANHTELVGRFSNGKTAVANNEQITQGIADAVYPAVYNAVASAMSLQQRDNVHGDISINIDGREVFRVTRNQANEYFRRTGRPAFDF